MLSIRAWNQSSPPQVVPPHVFGSVVFSPLASHTPDHASHSWANKELLALILCQALERYGLSLIWLPALLLLLLLFAASCSAGGLVVFMFRFEVNEGLCVLGVTAVQF